MPQFGGGTEGRAEIRSDRYDEAQPEELRLLEAMLFASKSRSTKPR